MVTSTSAAEWNEQPCLAKARVESCAAAAYRVPLEDGPESDGTLEWSATELVVVRLTSEGCEGLGYSYTAGLAARALIENKLAPIVKGEKVLALPMLWSRMNRALRNVGRPGLGLMAISAVDQALWDLKAKLLGVSLLHLWGKARDGVRVYGSGGFINQSDDQLRAQLRAWTEAGFSAVKIKIGGDVNEAARRVRLARDIVGDEIELMVDANGALDEREARALIPLVADLNICWLEEPLSSDNLQGLSRLRESTPGSIAIAAGEYGWDARYFQRMLNEAAVDCLQADATRCGYSGFLQAASLCEAYEMPLSAHCAPAAHVSLCASVPRVRHLEYFVDHARIEDTLFSSHSRLLAGVFYPNERVPGHGLSFKDEEGKAYALH